MSSILEVRELRKTFTWSDWQGFWLRRLEVSALESVDLEVRAGECLALIGESGSGKTTLARCLLGLETPDSGEIEFAGRNLSALTRNEQRRAQRRVQMVFQNNAGALDPRWRISRSVAEGVTKKEPVRGDDIEALLDMVGLPAEVADRFPHQLSGGQRQRVCIARALAAEPELLILDEPVSALDAAIRSRILGLLADLRQRLGLTMIFIGHDLPVVGEIADRVAVMYLGRIVEMGAVDEIFQRPKHPYTAGLLASAPSLTRSFTESRELRLRGEIPSAVDPPAGCVFHPRCSLQGERCRSAEPALVADENHAVACYFPLSRDAPHRQKAGADSVTFDE